MQTRFPDLGEWHDTRRSLHAWSKVLSAVRGSLAEPHPNWWHISLAVTPTGLSTGPLGDDGSGAPAAELDLQRHALVLRAGDRLLDALTLSPPPTVDRLSDWLLDRLRSRHGLTVELADDAWPPRSTERYLAESAERYHRALRAAAGALAEGALGGCPPALLRRRRRRLAGRRVSARGLRRWSIGSRGVSRGR